MGIIMTNIGYIHIDARWKSNDKTNDIDSYYSDIRDELQEAVPDINPKIRLEYTHKLAVIQTKKAFKIPGHETNGNYAINTEGEFIQ